MADNKTLNTRLVNKHDVEANWLKAVNFIPLQGEIIVYDIDENYNYERFKIGDGATNISALPFVEDIFKNNLNIKNGTGEKAIQQDGNTASGDHSVAFGVGTVASGNQSVAMGIKTEATEDYGIVVGKFNEAAPGAAVVVGNGNASVARSNAATIDWDGNAWFAGNVSVGENKVLATQEYVDSKALVADWNQNDENAPDYVKNRTHYVDTSRVQMGEGFQPTVWVPFKPEGVVDSTNIGGMVKVSDLTPEVDTLIATGSAYPDSTDNAKYTLQQTTTTDYGVTLATATSRGVQKYNAIAIVYQAGHAVCSNYDRRGQENSEYYAVLNEPGIYVNYGNTGVPSDLHIDHLTWGETVPLDEKYIPSTIARISDIPEIDPTLTIEGAAADAKVVGDLWRAYPDDNDVFDLLVKIGIYQRLADETGTILTDETGNILLL